MNTQSSHAYGIGLLTVLVGMSTVIIFYTSFYLPEQMAKPSISEKVEFPEIYPIEIIPGAVLDNGLDFSPKNAVIMLGVNNKAVWTNNDDTPHTVTPDHRYEDKFSGIFESPGVIRSGETYSFLFTDASEIDYRCTPHPWMEGTITIEKNRF